MEYVLKPCKENNEVDFNKLVEIKLPSNGLITIIGRESIFAEVDSTHPDATNVSIEHMKFRFRKGTVYATCISDNASFLNEQMMEKNVEFEIKPESDLIVLCGPTGKLKYRLYVVNNKENTSASNALNSSVSDTQSIGIFVPPLSENQSQTNTTPIELVLIPSTLLSASELKIIETDILQTNTNESPGPSLINQPEIKEDVNNNNMNIEVIAESKECESKVGEHEERKGIKVNEEEEGEEEKDDYDDEEEDEDDDYRDTIHSLLKSGSLMASSFACGGVVKSTVGFPAIEIEGIGRLAFPLPRLQASEIIKIAEQAPFGKGE